MVTPCEHFEDHDWACCFDPARPELTTRVIFVCGKCGKTMTQDYSQPPPKIIESPQLYGVTDDSPRIGTRFVDLIRRYLGGADEG